MYYSIKIKVLIILLLIFKSAFSQSNFEDVVYLKNGSIIHGVIVEQVISEYIKIKDNNRNTWVYKTSEIQKLTREESPNSNLNNTNNTNNSNNSNIDIPTEDIARTYLINEITKESENRLIFLDFKKINGQKVNYGYDAYIMDFLLTIKPAVNIFKRYDLFCGYFCRDNNYIDFTAPTKEDPWLSKTGINVKMFSPNQNIIITGNITFEKKEKGWVVVPKCKLISQIKVSGPEIEYSQMDQKNKDDNLNNKKNQDNNVTYLKAPKGNFGETYYFKVNEAVNNCNNCSDKDFRFYYDNFVDRFIISNRFIKINKDEFEKLNDSQKESITFYLDDIKYIETKTSSGQVSNDIQLYHHYEWLDVNSKVTYKENLKTTAEKLLSILTYDEANINLVINLNVLAANIAVYYFPIQSDLISVNEQNNNKIKSISISNASYLDTRSEIGIILIKSGDVIVINGGLTGKTKTAKALVKEVNGDIAICKVIEGGEQLKKLIDQKVDFSSISTLKSNLNNITLSKD